MTTTGSHMESSVVSQRSNRNMTIMNALHPKLNSEQVRSSQGDARKGYALYNDRVRELLRRILASSAKGQRPVKIKFVDSERKYPLKEVFKGPRR